MITMLFTGGIMIACSNEEIIEDGSIVEGGNQPVTLALSVQDITPSIVESRATDEEEKYLNNLQVFIFNSGGNLKGYTRIDNSSELAQNGAVGSVKVQTRTGSSYIYAIANYNSSIYKVNLPSGLNAEDALAGNIDFTLDDFKALAFNRTHGEITIADVGFLMSGSANNGGLCNIESNNEGNAYISNLQGEDKIIKLKRVVSKVTFNISVAEGKTFTPTRYDIMNIPLNGNLISGGTVENVTFDDKKDLIFSPNSPNSFEVYLPENLQLAKNEVTNWDDRETNSYSNEIKSFTNAPDNGTYVVIYGDYHDETNKMIGDINYTIHLGNFTTDINNYNNERNYRYTYNIKIEGVDKIKAEAEQNGSQPWQPGAEGFVLNYNSGMAYIMDSHYESCVMRFTLDEIKSLKDQGQGYIYQVKTHQGETDVVMVTNNEISEDKLNGVDISWIEFYEGVANGNQPLTYTAAKGLTSYDIHSLLGYLYSIADNENEWTDGEYLDFTCFISENYYDDLSWAEYVNVDPRSFSIANNVYVSDDKMSVYADVKYNISQYAIQTFYNRDLAGSIVAYGCETINDEEEMILHDGNMVERGTTMTVSNVGNSSESGENGYRWDGKTLTKRDLGWVSDNRHSWPYDESLELFHKACMARNRDLDQDGFLDEDEIRWYTPSLPQLTGLWIGEEAIATNARLYNKDMTDVEFRTINIVANSNGRVTERPTNGALKNHMHYYTSTNPQRVFWAEEGMAYGEAKNGYVSYIRCVRTLKSNDEGYSAEPDQYYSVNGSQYDLSNVDLSALRTSTVDTELNMHNEREPLNRPRVSFSLAKDGVKKNGNYSIFNLETVQTSFGASSPCGQYSEDGKSWRIPNQREFALIILSGELDDATPNYSCRTGYSGNHRFGYRYSSNVLSMIEVYRFSFPNHMPQFEGLWGWDSGEDQYRIRCVSDE